MQAGRAAILTGGGRSPRFPGLLPHGIVGYPNRTRTEENIMKNVVPSARRQSEAIRRMVTAAMLSAITAVLTFTPIGMIPLPPPLLSATTVHLPVILAALVEGPVVGLVVGLVFGLCSFIRAWESGAVGLTLFFRNPLVSVLPRLLVPLVALGVYLLWKRFAPRGAVSDKVGAAVASAAGSVANTALCLGMLLVIYGADLTQLINNMISAGSADAAYLNDAGAWLVTAVGLPNGIGEAVVAAVIVPMIKIAVEAVMRRSRRAPARRAHSDK